MPATLPVLNRRFHSIDEYSSRSSTGYSLLPFRFIQLEAGRYVLTNFAGEHLVVLRHELQRLVQHELPLSSPLYDELKSKHFVMDGDSTVALDLLAAKYRTKKAFLEDFTSLFMFVATLRCEHSCPYCQVSRQTQDTRSFDMTPELADRAVDFMFKSPSGHIKVEFQGGEPLLNFPLIQHTVHRVLQRNEQENRSISFVIATNLALITDEMLAFCQEHSILISTSLDGPAAIHNQNRPRLERDSHARAIKGISKARETLGFDRVSALMTTTAASLREPEAIVEEYVRMGFSSIFLRWLSPYGFAVKTKQIESYDADAWLTFYRRALDRIIYLNLNGTFLREEYSALILRKILTPYSTGYVDLQSPTGLGISCLIFNYDGGVYASDESRMLAEMGDQRFRIGDLRTDSFEDVMTSEALVGLVRDTMTEGMPMCSDCGFQPYCGSDPVHHYATQGDDVGFKPTSTFCRRNMGVMRHLISLLEDDPEKASVLRTWAY